MLLLKTTCTLGLYAVSGGQGLWASVAGNWLSEQIPACLRALLQEPLRDPNHDLNHAFHAAVRETLVRASGKRNPLNAFQEDHAAEWNTLHAGQRNAIKGWLHEIAIAAKDHETAAKSPLIPLEDAVLKSLAEDRTGTTTQALLRDLRDALSERFAKVNDAKVGNQNDPQVDHAVALFIDWFTRQLGTQLGVHFWEQLKKNEKARTAYFGLVAEAMQQLLGEIAGHAVGAREDLIKLSGEQRERHEAINKALVAIRQAQKEKSAAISILNAVIEKGQEKLERSLTNITSQLNNIDRSLQQLVDGTQPALYHQSEQAFGVRGGIVSVKDLNYKSRLIPFQPRPLDTARLDDFLFSPPRFTWWAVIGPGGMGKSRLAQEIIQQRIDAGWQAGFLGGNESNWLQQVYKSWQPAFPTLIVIDYASERAADLLPLLANLQQRQNELRQPVRVLLLDRPGFLGPLFSDIFARPNTDDQALRLSLAALWRPGADAPPSQIEEGHLLRLAPVPQAEWPHYLSATLHALDQISPEWPVAEAEFWRHIARITHVGRPLYLQMAAISLHLEGQGQPEVNLSERSSAHLIDAMLRHELTKYWPLVLQAEQAAHLEPTLRRAVGFITLTRGLDLNNEDETKALREIAVLSDQDHDAFNSALCALLPPDDHHGRLLPPMQPDLLGERYLLLGGATPVDPNAPARGLLAAEPKPHFHTTEWMPRAFAARGSYASETMRLLLQDFASIPQLIPQLEAALTACLSLPDQVPELPQSATLHALIAGVRLSWYPALSHLAREGKPLPDKLINPLTDAIRSRPEPKLQAALLLPLVLLLEECGADPALLTWSTSHLLPSIEELESHLQPPAALLAAKGSVIAISHCDLGGQKLFQEMQQWLRLLETTARAHPDLPNIQLELAKGSYNALTIYGSGGPEHFPAMERWLGVLLTTAQACPQQSEIQLLLAKGANNSIIDYGLAGPNHQSEFLHWLEVLEATAREHPQHPEIQLCLVKGAFDAITLYGSGGREYFPAMERWLGVLEASAREHPQHPEIQLEMAKGSYNATTFYAREGPEYFPDMERWLEVLEATARAQPWQLEIQLALAKGALKATDLYRKSGPEYFEAMIRWQFSLELTAHAHPRQPEIQLEMATGAYNMSLLFGSGGPEHFPSMERFLDVLKATALAHPEQPEIQNFLAKGSYNATTFYAREGPEYFPDMERWLEVLEATARAHPRQLEIQLEMAKGVFNACLDFGGSGPEYFSVMERWLGVLETTAQAHPQQSEIQIRLANGAFNAISHYGSGGPDHFPAMIRWLGVLTEVPDLGLDVLSRLPILIVQTQARLRDAAIAAGLAIYQYQRPVFRALRLLCLRHPDLPMAQAHDGQNLTIGQYAARFLTDEGEGAA